MAPRRLIVPAAVRIAALAAIALTLFVRIRLRDTPLERDEGEYAYTGQLMLQGIPPFELSSNMKLPGVDASYAVIMAIFGQTAAGVHTGFLLVNLATAALVFFLARRLFDPTAAWAAAASYTLLTIGMGVLGTSAHATHFVVLPAVGATLLLLRWRDSGRTAILFLSGLLYGLAVLMKQPGVIFGVFGGLFVLWTQRRRLRVFATWIEFAWFAAGCCLPLALALLILWRAGVFARFWFWTFQYGRAYGSVISLSNGIFLLLGMLPRVISPNWLLWILAVAGMVIAWQRKLRSARFAAAFLLFSFLAVCPGFYFRAHYFVLLLPAIAILAGGAVSFAAQRSAILPAVLIAAAIVIPAIADRDFFFTMTGDQLSRRMYWPNPFPEALQIADYIKNHSAPDARVAILGSEPEIYYYSQRHSSIDYIYTYALGEPQPYAQSMQDDLIHKIVAAPPEYVVAVNVYTSWLSTPAESRILNWFASFARDKYQLTGAVDLVDPDHSLYRWDAAAASVSPTSANFLRIYRLR